MVIRAKTKLLFQGKPLTKKQEKNSNLNLNEIDKQKLICDSLPRRLVFELTNNCNLNCKMCGRFSADFKLTNFNMEWFKYFEPMFDTIEEVTLMGWGEPTMHPNFIEMLKIIDKHSARKYFCTNGMNLNLIKEAIFDYHVDVFAVSLDGSTYKSNSKIRKGSDINKITHELKDIIRIRNEKGLKYPWINFVFCAMKSNLQELPDIIKIAHDCGIDEVKVVFLTSFSDEMTEEVLWGCEKEIKNVFDEAIKLGKKYDIALKLPYIPGEDIAKNKFHKDCFVPYRDFFLGSDGYVRPCMSTSKQFFKFDTSKSFDEMWNSKEFQRCRKIVNKTDKMDLSCKKCYQSSVCNWNKKESFIQVDEQFSPDWKIE